MKIATAFLALLAALRCAAGNDKIAGDLQYKNKTGDVAVIVQFAGDAPEPDVDGVQKKGGKLKARLGSVAAYLLPADQVEAVAAMPDVTYISPDRAVHGQLNY